jgi:hypothetical protein
MNQKGEFKQYNEIPQITEATVQNLVATGNLAPGTSVPLIQCLKWEDVSIKKYISGSKYGYETERSRGMDTEFNTRSTTICTKICS